MGKNHKDRDLEGLLPQALDILKHYYKEDAKPTDYIFPMLDNNEPWAAYVTQEDKDKMPADLKRRMFQVIGAKNALINKELHKMKEMAGIDKPISFHISRHSFAKMAKDKGLDNLEVKALLAHSNLATTQAGIWEILTLPTTTQPWRKCSCRQMNGRKRTDFMINCKGCRRKYSCEY